MATLELRVQSVHELTPDIKSFELVSSEGGSLPDFEAGAHVDVETGAGVWRSYSLANDPTEQNRYLTAVLREVDGGGGSKWMHDNVSEGDVLTIREPSNNFPLDEEADEHILIAGGIGVTPMLAMVHRLKAIGAKYTFHYCTKAPELTAFREDLTALCGDNVILHHDGGDPSKGIKLTEVLAERPEGAHLYICGPSGLLNAAKEAADHWPLYSVHVELFSSALSGKSDEETDSSVDEAFEIELAKSGMTLTVPADKSIMEVLEDAGVEVDYVCREGWCATCETPMLSGKADHRDEVLDDEEKAANERIQICVSRALPGEKLILDL